MPSSFAASDGDSAPVPLDLLLSPAYADERRALIGPEASYELRRRGHDVEVVDPWSLGRLSGVSRAPDGVLRAGANPRGMQGYAVGR